MRVLDLAAEHFLPDAASFSDLIEKFSYRASREDMEVRYRQCEAFAPERVFPTQIERDLFQRERLPLKFAIV